VEVNWRHRWVKTNNVTKMSVGEHEKRPQLFCETRQESTHPPLLKLAYLRGETIIQKKKEDDEDPNNNHILVIKLIDFNRGIPMKWNSLNTTPCGFFQNWWRSSLERPRTLSGIWSRRPDQGRLMSIVWEDFCTCC
jgi:hypothetical protein